MTSPAPSCANPIRVGDRANHAVVVDQAAMEGFRQGSGDVSGVHVDEAFAVSRGYQGVIVHGGILTAQLSHPLGMKPPGADRVSTRWSTDYRQPLHVGQPARIEFEVSHVSPSHGMIEGRFKSLAGDVVVASRATQSLVRTARAPT
ncbi:MAG: hypothetical protein JWM33_848 [Caulobacteraceae bacterium]|nr:hypothetical protein [Caulobacteraceae bacterium]